MSSAGSSGGGGSYFSAAGDLFSGIGSLIGGLSEASGYRTAAKMEKQNAQLEKESGAIKLLLQQRKELQSFGATKAGFAGGGVRSDTAGALSIIAEAHSNAALDNAMIRQQTQINVNADLAEAAQYEAKAAAAESGGIFSFLGSVASAIGSVAAFA